MDTSIQMLTGWLSFVCVLAVSAVVLSAHIREGLVIKIGLIMMAIGLFSSGVITLKGFDSLNSLWHAAFLMRVGLLITSAGYGWHLLATRKTKP